MIHDPGSVRIQRLLETPSAPLASAVEALGTGLDAAEGLNGEVPASTTAAIDKLRGIYGGMAGQIKKIETDNFGPKNEALAALTKMDSGLAILATSLQQGSSEAAQRSVTNAVQRIEAAGTGLDSAVARFG
jgi:hypothetical protein